MARIAAAISESTTATMAPPEDRPTGETSVALSVAWRAWPLALVAVGLAMHWLAPYRDVNGAGYPLGPLTAAGLSDGFLFDVLNRTSSAAMVGAGVLLLRRHRAGTVLLVWSALVVARLLCGTAFLLGVLPLDDALRALLVDSGSQVAWHGVVTLAMLGLTLALAAAQPDGAALGRTVEPRFAAGWVAGVAWTSAAGVVFAIVLALFDVSTHVLAFAVAAPFVGVVVGTASADQARRWNTINLAASVVVLAAALVGLSAALGPAVT